MKKSKPAQAAQSVDHSERSAPVVSALNDNGVSDVALDQYYTREDVAAYLYGVFARHFDPGDYRMVEPSAGTGAFFRLMPPGSLAYDVDPKFPGILSRDFLGVSLPTDRPVATLGNPPFGRNASMAKRFFNHAAAQAEIVALILPRSFRKASIQNQLDRRFHRLHEEIVERDAFRFRGKPYDVPAVFQIWVRQAQLRALRDAVTSHPDFAFTGPDDADFAIQRVGANAGRVHHNLAASPRSHYFVRGPVEAIMRQLDLASVAADVAGNPSLAKSEIVSLYRAWMRSRGRTAAA